MKTRRDFLRTGVGALALAACSRASSAQEAKRAVGGPAAHAGSLPTRRLGKTGLQVSILALGGSHLGDVKHESDAVRIVDEAIDHGVNFFDNAWEYHDGESERRLGKALRGKRDKVVLMTKVCSHGRSAEVAMAQLEESLRRLETDHLDLWQVHEVVYDDDPELAYANDGVLRALDQAKQQGKVRFVGFTGHKDPSIHLAMLSRGYAFDTVQMPLNCFDASFRSFETRVLPEAVRRQMGAIGMKSLCGSGAPVLKGAVTAQEALRYVFSLPVSTIVSGVDSLEVLRQNLAIASSFEPMPLHEMHALRARTQALASDGHFELYKTTKHFDAKVGREQHGYPTKEDLPL